MTQIPVDDEAVVHTRDEGNLHEIASDIAYQRLGIVNVVYVGPADTGPWVLIDAGVAGSAGMIRRAARRFGGVLPDAIIMTHAHFDHVGALEELAEDWDVPVYAHALELPYLNGSEAYPPPDPTVGGGLMARMSPLFPRGPVNVSANLHALPPDYTIPHMPGWQWLHTPGHTPGHVSFWRENNLTLIAGDAFVTTAQESVYAVAMQKPELHGPPLYFTQDFVASADSVRRLAALNPDVVITGHGRPMHGELMRAALHELADHFEEVAVPPDREPQHTR